MVLFLYIPAYAGDGEIMNKKYIVLVKELKKLILMVLVEVQPQN